MLDSGAYLVAGFYSDLVSAQESHLTSSSCRVGGKLVKDLSQIA